jgi:sec-independent protein translocase protein TatA
MPLGPWELVIILLIVVIIFGAGRLADIGGALGKSVREFRNATRDESEKEKAAASPSVPTSSTEANTPPAAKAENKCPSCGTVNPDSQVFCGQCGTRLTVPV